MHQIVSEFSIVGHFVLLTSLIKLTGVDSFFGLRVTSNVRNYFSFEAPIGPFFATFILSCSHPTWTGFFYQSKFLM